MGAAMAVQAATRQKKGWEMHDKCFENNTALTPADLEKYAKEIGLDMAKYKKDLEDPTLKQQVEADSKIGTAAGASGTPTFFINGRILVGAQGFEKFQEIINEEIKQADALIAAGTPKSEVYKKRSTTQ
jgi:protein-disulfide isomerase